MDFPSISSPSAAGLPSVHALGSERTTKRGVEKGSICQSDILSVYIEGGPKYVLDTQSYEYAAPMAILIPSGTYDHDHQQGPVDGVFVLFDGHGMLRKDPSAPGQSLVSAGDRQLSVPYLKPISRADAEKLTAVLRAIGEISPGDPIGQIRRAGLLLQAVAMYCEARARETTGNVHREAQRLRELIHAWAFENVSMARIYQELDLSPAHSETLFVRAFGLSAVAYRIRLRLNRARELLMSSKLNVSQVAFEVGFTDPLYFSRAFKRQFGVTPSSLIVDFSNTRK